MVLNVNKSTALFVRIATQMMFIDKLRIGVFRYPSENRSKVYQIIPFQFHFQLALHCIKLYKRILSSYRECIDYFQSTRVVEYNQQILIVMMNQMSKRVGVGLKAAIHAGNIFLILRGGFMTSGHLNYFQLHANTNPWYRCNEKR